MKKSNPFGLQFTSTVLTRIALGVGISTVAIASALLPQVTLAQSAQDLQNPGNFTSPNNERNSFDGSIGGSGFSLFNVIHNVQLGGWRDPNEVANEQRESINKATEEFRRIQLEQLRNSQSQEQASPVNLSPSTPTGY